MPVTELAQLRLKPGVSLDDRAVRDGLVKIKQAMEDFTNQRFYYFLQVEDETVIYIIGSWKSPKQHLEEWLPSQANQELLVLCKDMLTVEWMWHVDVEQTSLPLEAPTIAIGRHFIPSDKREAFSQKFAAVKHNLESWTEPHRLADGWRLEKEAADKEEWVLFSGWKDVSDHQSFGQSGSFQEYSQIREFVDGFDIKHAAELHLTA